jgi:hypothetical protein
MDGRRLGRERQAFQILCQEWRRFVFEKLAIPPQVQVVHHNLKTFDVGRAKSLAIADIEPLISYR